MLKRYQEKYKKQKQDSYKSNNSYPSNNTKKVFDVTEKQKKQAKAEADSNDSEEEYINRSFVSTSKTGKKKGTMIKANETTTTAFGEKDTVSRPFDFIDNSTTQEDQYRQND